MSKPHLHVAIAILLHQNQVLVGWREAHQHQGSKSEFPGGKVEAQETPQQACRREVLEEVGIEVSHCYPFDLIQHEYDDLIVNLHVFQSHVSASQASQIQAPWQWVTRQDLSTHRFPKANQRLIQRLSLAKQIKISAQLQDLNALTENQYLYWQVEHSMDALKQLAEFSVEQLKHLVINIDLWKKLNTIQQQSVAMIQLSNTQLQQLESKDLIRGKAYLASCLDETTLQQAAQLGVDAVLLPVNHQAAAIGELDWHNFAAIAQTVEIPVYAVGRLSQDMLHQAQSHHAYGIAFS